jgi:signal transduction histidine kinase
MRGGSTRHAIEVRSESDVWAEIDTLRYEQVVLNLLDNAMKYSPQGGTIEVDLSEQPSGVARLVVRDHGIGVPAQHRAHLFERYYQAHGREHRSGMGLGLYISREIVERHGGRIAADFPIDGGTRVIVEVPTAPPPEQE